MIQKSLPFPDIPFSRYGSYFAISQDQDGSIYLRDLHGGDMAQTRLYRFDFNGVNPKCIQTQMSESQLVFQLPDGMCMIAMDENDTVYISCTGIAIRLVAMENRYDSIISLDNLSSEHQFYSKNIKIRLMGEGEISVESRWCISESKDISVQIDGRNKKAVCALQYYRTTPKKECPASLETAAIAAADAAENDYIAWRNAAADGHKASQPSPTIEKSENRLKSQGQADDEMERIAKYILWSNFVHAEGCLEYDAMYMNKFAMGNIWSWDNCFGAIALAEEHPEQALEQLLVIFACQDDSGMLPDYVNDAFASFSCLKPPIYGFAIQKLREKNEFFRTKNVSEILYDKVSKLTEFWLSHRVDPQQELPCYYHGNDSGWDNASVFHAGVPICTPDLSAYLIQQMDVLSELANELGKQDESAMWTKRANDLQVLLLEKLYDGEKFVSRLCKDGCVNQKSRSLINLLPVVIAGRLSKSIVKDMVHILEQDFECTYGLATECEKSDYYKKGGYWLGPVWAPVSYIFIDALKRNGYDEIAGRLAEKFMRLPLIGLMAENFDPITGEGYDDNAFAWTAAVYVLLKSEKCLS